MKQFSIFRKGLNLIKNFYFTGASIFLIWMLFFDTNNIFNQVVLHDKAKEFQAEKSYYKQEIMNLEQKLKDLEDPYYVERFARQKYHFKKKGEDIYIIKRRATKGSE